MEKQNRLFEGLWRQTLTVMVMISLSKIGATTIDGIIMARVYGADSSAAGKKRLLSDEKYAAIFAFIHDGAITLRIYDNCVLFDPAEKRKSLEAHEKDPERGLGLKLVFSMADEATYTSMLNMNHMLIMVPLRDRGASPKAGKQGLICVDERFLPDALNG